MTHIRYEHLPDNPRHPDIHAWRTWVERHGLDPKRILLATPITANDATRTVTAYYLRLDHGHVVHQGDGNFAIDRVTVQLEAPALPFPQPSTNP